MSPSDEVWVSDFNIILLSSVANFGDASKIRVGKLNGITDPVFGQFRRIWRLLTETFCFKILLNISGTLTAG